MNKMPTILISSNRSEVAPFYAMEIMREAHKLEQIGKNIIHLEVGIFEVFLGDYVYWKFIVIGKLRYHSLESIFVNLLQI